MTYESTIRDHRQLDVRVGLFGRLDFEKMSRARSEGHNWQEEFPLFVPFLISLFRVKLSSTEKLTRASSPFKLFSCFSTSFSSPSNLRPQTSAAGPSFPVKLAVSISKPVKILLEGPRRMMTLSMKKSIKIVSLVNVKNRMNVILTSRGSGRCVVESPSHRRALLWVRTGLSSRPKAVAHSILVSVLTLEQIIRGRRVGYQAHLDLEKVASFCEELIGEGNDLSTQSNRGYLCYLHSEDKLH